MFFRAIYAAVKISIAKIKIDINNPMGKIISRVPKWSKERVRRFSSILTLETGQRFVSTSSMKSI